MRRYVVSAVFLSLMVCSLAFSQGGNAQLGGVVTDPTAALLPGVTVTVTNTETSVTNTAVTNESGAYTFPSLQPGKAYRVTAALPGFSCT
jgi:Carboxypeptidase regulatory-like domain